MTTVRRPADAREKDLKLALYRIVRGRSKTGEKQVSIAAVAREAGVSPALIHNHYQSVAEAIREAQGRSSRARQDVKQQDLKTEKERNRVLRNEVKELRAQLASLASINEVLLIENSGLKSKQKGSNVIDFQVTTSEK